MTLKEYIEALQELSTDETCGEQIEVVAWDDKFGESYSPVTSVRSDKDGVRRLFVA